jgi:hypothetical protein
MCFVLYVGTTRPLPRRKFDKDVADLPVESVTERDAGIAQHFTAPEVQYVGSTSGCGCDFPHAMFQSGGWPEIEYHRNEGRDEEKDELDIATDRTHRQNCKALVALLRTTGEKLIELYGVWDGNFAVVPKARETISIDRLLDPDFYFKEEGFYEVYLEPPPHS